MKTLLVVGDSISLQYGEYFKQFVSGMFDIYRKEGLEAALQNLDIPIGGNGGDSSMVRQYLSRILLDEGHFYHNIVFNCGLHDIKVDVASGKIQVPLAEYATNLRFILDLLQQRGIVPIWVRTTMVQDERHNSRIDIFKRYNRDVLHYNETADAIVSEYGVDSIDLYSFTERFGDEAYSDHIHFKPHISALQAAFMAGYLARYC
ncbi:MAG: Lipolytic protein family [Paenibacillaceae bacterium]|jgi:lysophospholipase L1-like esterase|nr:Lipolytic protein family [Paenibacillaceae bacterium]